MHAHIAYKSMHAHKLIRVYQQMTPLIKICLITERQYLYHDLFLYTELVAATKHTYVSLHLFLIFNDKKMDL